MSKYLLATYTTVPRDKSITHTKGFWSDENNSQYDEQIILSKKLKNRDLTESGIILDLENKKIIKNRVSPTATYDQIYEYFKKNYAKELTYV